MIHTEIKLGQTLANLEKLLSRSNENSQATPLTSSDWSKMLEQALEKTHERIADQLGEFAECFEEQINELQQFISKSLHNDGTKQSQKTAPANSSNESVSKPSANNAATNKVTADRAAAHKAAADRAAADKAAADKAAAAKAAADKAAADKAAADKAAADKAAADKAAADTKQPQQK